MRCAIRSPRICWRAAATCARSRNCSATPRSRPRRSIRRSTASNCCRFIAARIPRSVTFQRQTPNSPCGAARLRFNRRGSTGEAAMAGPHENLEHAEHAQHAAHEGGRDNKKIALIISVLALFLAFSETFGKSAQTAALNLQIEASNLWNFFQAKNIRRTLTIVQSEAAKIELATDDRRGAQGRARQADRRMEQDGGALSLRAGGRRRQGRGDGGADRGARRRWKRSAIFSSTSTTISNSPPRRSRSASCCARPRSSPASWRWPMRRSASACVGVLLMGDGLCSCRTFLHDVLHWFEALFAGGGHH